MGSFPPCQVMCAMAMLLPYRAATRAAAAAVASSGAAAGGGGGGWRGTLATARRRVAQLLGGGWAAAARPAASSLRPFEATAEWRTVAPDHVRRPYTLYTGIGVVTHCTEGRPPLAVGQA